MHTIKLNVGDSIYGHLMFLLKNLKTDELEIVEDEVKDTEYKEIESPSWHKQILEERIEKIKNSKATFLSLEELKNR